MAWADWDESTVADTAQASTLGAVDRANQVALSDRLKEMIYGFTNGESLAGGGNDRPGFKELIFKQQAGAPGTPNADEITLYCIDDGSNAGLYAIQEDGYTKQLLKKVGSDINFVIEAADIPANVVTETHIELSNNAAMTAKNQAGDGTVNLILAGTNDLPTLPDSAEMASNAAPVEDEAITNKKYVDAHGAVQTVNTQTGALITDTTNIPDDDTIPQITEGTLCLTRAITPTNASNKLKIEVVIQVAARSGLTMVGALFQDATANALACGTTAQGSTNRLQSLSFTHYMTAGTTSSTSFTIRFGCDAGTASLNGQVEVRLYGGVCISSITITEIKV